MLAQVMINARERVKELWSVVEKSESPYVKLLALRELRIHDQQVLNHLFLFTQATNEEKDEIDKHLEDILDAQNVSQPRLRTLPGHCEDERSEDAAISSDKENGNSNPPFSVNSRRKSLSHKDLNLPESSAMNSSNSLATASHQVIKLTRCGEKDFSEPGSECIIIGSEERPAKNEWSVKK